MLKASISMLGSQISVSKNLKKLIELRNQNFKMTPPPNNKSQFKKEGRDPELSRNKNFKKKFICKSSKATT
jgi:hypothetical protein